MGLWMGPGMGAIATCKAQEHCLGSGCDSIFAVRGRDLSLPVSATGATGFSVFLCEQCKLHPNVLHKPLAF